ncbi:MULTISPECIES: TetR/AcrR family transcriptional regulator [unclassified Mesorhizobium]|uniref:TetR/AcrR family transcriptional regulator n=1 Tax=unclassified Mesorhizobium TaxID=325217 RepID=UPI000FC9F595|nr:MULTISPECIES: TetR/AcrR family transcriptional regulator [unclassified Mesorhizobium]RUV12528.1 TetR/AcrR family transcriptional regulator [Mesorhizobium sp. M1A.F.Ca.IN.022.04.1.1]RWG30481.1 MAG: TetR/AcrR family transcriptional regulator [Mesorhizobium sp.]
MPSSPSAKRQHVVDTAYSLFKRDGFHATGIDRIIAEADIAKMTMYRHFPAKDDLIVAVLEHRAARFERQLDGLAASLDTAEAKIFTILDWHERWFRDPAFHGCLFAHALAEFGDPDHPVFKAASRQKKGLRARLRAILEEEMPPERAEGVATALLMLIEGATLMAQLGEADAAIANARKAASAILAGARGPQ